MYYKEVKLKVFEQETNSDQAFIYSPNMLDPDFTLIDIEVNSSGGDKFKTTLNLTDAEALGKELVKFVTEYKPQ